MSTECCCRTSAFGGDGKAETGLCVSPVNAWFALTKAGMLQAGGPGPCFPAHRPLLAAPRQVCCSSKLTPRLRVCKSSPSLCQLPATALACSFPITPVPRKTKPATESQGVPAIATEQGYELRRAQCMPRTEEQEIKLSLFPATCLLCPCYVVPEGKPENPTRQ